MRSGWTNIDLGVSAIGVGPESKQRVHNYELANVLAVPYLSGEIPTDDVLLQDLQSFAPLLGILYGLGTGPLPVPSNKSASTAFHKGQGHQMDTVAKIEVESHAMGRAQAHYEKQGWKVDPSVSKTEPFDLLCEKNGGLLHVEVKGTVGFGEHERPSTPTQGS